MPQWFEFGFGLPDDQGRDAASRRDPVTLDGRFILRGSMDLVERHPAGALRVTDHKTGRARWPERMIVAGGEALQPLLYGLALEAATGQPVRRRAPVVLHGRRRVRRALGAADRDDAPHRARGARDRRPRRRARHAGAVPEGTARASGATSRRSAAPVRSAERHERSRAGSRTSTRCEASRDRPRDCPADAGRSRSHSHRSRPLLRRRGGGGHRQDDRAGGAHHQRARLRSRRRHHRQDRRRDLHREGRGRAEAAPARGARSRRASGKLASGATGWSRRCGTWKRRASARSTASVRTCCASGPSRRASTRSSRS